MRARALCTPLLALSLWLLPATADARAGFDRQVVSLSVSVQSWDEDRPWTKRNPSSHVASAVVIGDSLLLTRAYVVANSTLIQVEKLGNARPVEARVVHSDAEIDLALLSVDDPRFFEDLTPVKFAERLPTEGELQSVRWRKRQLEVARGQVTRIEVLANRYGNVEHAFLQLSGALANGGWAEPVFAKKRLVGLTAPSEKSSAWVIPTELLQAYLARALGPEPYRGFAKLGVVWQNSQDDALASYLRLEGDPRGILIRRARRGSSACGALMPRDILLELDGHAIDAIGNYEHERYGRLRFTNLAVEGRAPGDRIGAKVLRDGEIRQIELELKTYASSRRLIPWRRDGEAPPYLVVGGLVFRELDGSYLRSWGDDWSQNAPSELVTTYHIQGHAQEPDRRRVIVLSAVLPDRYNLGYHDVSDLIVERVNGLPIDSVRDVAEAFGKPDGNYHVVELEPNSQRIEIVLDASQLEEASERIAQAYQIPSPIRTRDEEFPPLGPPCE